MADTLYDNFFELDRIYQNKTAIEELNVYRTWGAFGLQIEPTFEPSKDNPNDPNLWWNNGKNAQHLGTKSLFSNVNAVPLAHEVRISNNMPLLDSQTVRDEIRKRGGCSIAELVEASEQGLMGRAIYNYSDFMYCKHLGKMSNNYLITLRRFPFPAGDHINFNQWLAGNPDITGDPEYQTNQHHPDIGRLVTWMGTPGNDLSEILKFNVLMPYKEMQSQIQEVNGTAENGGLLGSLCNMANPSYMQGVQEGYAGTGSISMLQKMLGSKAGNLIAGPQNADWAYYRDKSKPYGPTDVIASTHIRMGGDEGGLKFDQEIKLCFDYELRSYDGINGKAAMIDLLSNILAVTYANGKFWGGAIRSMGMSQSSLFTNLPIFQAPLDFNNMKDKMLDSISQIGQGFNDGQSVTSIKDLFNVAKNLLTDVGNLLVGGALNALGRPQKQGVDSLLTNNPVGLWHLTVGNPKHPIVSMGNMILTSVEVQQYGPLGLDDFPTGLRVNIGLKHGMPRDRLRIEQMYTGGDFRTYMPMGKDIKLMYDMSTEMKSSTNANGVDGIRASGKVNSNPVSEHNQITKRYMKYFGTENEGMISRAGQEGHHGSSSAIIADKLNKAALTTLSEKNQLEAGVVNS